MLSSVFICNIKNFVYLICCNVRIKIRFFGVVDKINKLPCFAAVIASVYLQTFSACKFHGVRNIIQMFRRNTGKTPIEYINSYRLYMSTGLLRNNNYTILDISMKCGFENVGYFIKLFKKEFGITPLKYRKQSESSDTGNISEAF